MRGEFDLASEDEADKLCKRYEQQAKSAHKKEGVATSVAKACRE